MKFVAMLLTLVSCQAFAFGGSSTVGPGNPASIECSSLGGQLEAVTTPEGQRNNCVLEEWRLFSAMNERGLVKPHQGNGGANPASLTCLDLGGTLRGEQTPAGQSNSCVIDEWALWSVFNK